MASGPSLCAEDATLVKRWREQGRGKVIVVNTTFRMAPWADVLYACDGGWWRVYGPEVDASFSGERYCYAQYGTLHGATQVKAQVGVGGLNKKPGWINTGGNSGHQAIHLSRNWGATEIILLGFDMGWSGGQSHWHGHHPSSLMNTGQFGLWIQHMNKLAADLKAEGVRVINSSRRTALECFERQSIEDALCLT